MAAALCQNIIKQTPPSKQMVVCTIVSGPYEIHTLLLRSDPGDAHDVVLTALWPNGRPSEVRS